MSQSWTINGLAGSSTVQQQYVRNSVQNGSYQAWALVDSGCAIDESDETNNAKNTFYAISPAGADLFISSFSAATTGNSVTFTASVCNAGTPLATSFVVGFYYNRAGAPGCAAAADAVVTQSSLASGACATVTHTRTSTPAGSYTGWAMADQACAIGESNESNNAASAGYVVAAPDLGVADTGVKPDSSVKPDTVTIKPDGAIKVDGPAVKIDGATKADLPTTKTDGLAIKADGKVSGDGARLEAGSIGTPDAGAGADLISDAAGEQRADAGKLVPPSDSGCGCSVSDAGAGEAVPLVLLLGLALAARRRSRRSRESRRS